MNTNIDKEGIYEVTYKLTKDENRRETSNQPRKKNVKTTLIRAGSDDPPPSVMDDR